MNCTSTAAQVHVYTSEVCSMVLAALISSHSEGTRDAIETCYTGLRIEARVALSRKCSRKPQPPTMQQSLNSRGVHPGPHPMI